MEILHLCFEKLQQRKILHLCLRSLDYPATHHSCEDIGLLVQSTNASTSENNVILDY
jgi:hypothetical protein